MQAKEVSDQLKQALNVKPKNAHLKRREQMKQATGPP